MLFARAPEYDADTLLREYCRDVGRFLCGKRACSRLAAHYLNLRTQQRWQL